MPVTLRSGRSSSRPLVMYAGRPKAASPSPIRETAGPPAPRVAAGMPTRLRRSPTIATTVPKARPRALGQTPGHVFGAPDKPICVLHVDDGEDLAITHSGGMRDLGSMIPAS